ncbi:MAG: acyl-CoA thioesterase [Bacteroidales bacterium]|nr:acyl-CoA thioesterase [Bacteroidales bacterium]
MYCTETKLRVRYGETDRMGYLYYGHYAEYFEVGRTEMLRSMGMTYKSMEDDGIILPVRSISINFRNPAHYDDLLTVKTCLKTYPEVKLDFYYEILNEDGVIHCTGNTVLVFVDNATKKLRKAPEYFKDAMRKYFL